MIVSEDEALRRRDTFEYRSGYKYQVAGGGSVQTDIRPGARIETVYITLELDGLLTVAAGYAWDGASGPVIDRPSVMYASLVHDALYQLERGGHLSRDDWREESDRLFWEICKEDGVFRPLAWAYYVGLRWFGGYAASEDGRKKVHWMGRKSTGVRD